MGRQGEEILKKNTQTNREFKDDVTNMSSGNATRRQKEREEIFETIITKNLTKLMSKTLRFLINKLTKIYPC